MRLVCTTTARSPADWSPELCLQYSPSTTGMAGSMIKGFNQAVQRYQLANPGAKPFPIGEINNRRKLHRKVEDDREGSPAQLREAGLDDWAEAVELFYRLSKTTRGGKRAAVKPLLDWALATGHTTPWGVRVSHLLNPLRSEDETTFHASVSRTSGSRKTLWSGAARFYSVVCNALKPIPEYDQKGIRNPFEGLSNPFAQREDRRATIGKTHRRLIPADLLNAMLDTLQEHVPDLLLSMPDGSRRRRASLLLADAIEILAGNGSLIGYDLPVPRMTAESSQMLREMAARLAADPESNSNQNLPEHPLSIEEAI